MRFISSNFSPSAPASFSSRFASARDFSMSGQKPTIFCSSSLVAASGEPGKTRPPTVCTVAILESAGAPFHWSIASASARRTRTSSNGFFLWLGVIRLTQFQSLVLHRDLVAELLDQLVARRRRHAAELGRGAVGADGVDADRLLGGEDAR